MGQERLNPYSSIPERGDAVVVDLGSQKLPAVVQCGTVEGRNETTVLVRLPPILNQTRPRLLKVDINDVAVALSASEAKSK